MARQDLPQKHIACKTKICPSGDGAPALPEHYAGVFRIREIREGRQPKMTLEQLSELSGIDYSLLSRYERGERWPSREKLTAIAAALQVPVHQLFDDYREPLPAERELSQELRNLTVEELRAALRAFRAFRGTE